MIQKLWRWRRFSPWLDVLAIFSWGVLLLKYWITGELRILIHPNYFALTVAGGITLIVMAIYQAQYLWKEAGMIASRPPTIISDSRSSDLQKVWSAGTLLLLGVALMGLISSPRPFTSQAALQRGLTDSMPVTRLQPQEFRSASKPEDRSLVEWIRTLNVYPEPDAYTGQKANVQGFVLYPPSLPAGYFWVTRFIITCCAADAYPVGLPVKIPENESRQFPADSWVEVTGKMITETFDGQRQLTIQGEEIKPIPQPKNPYDY